MSSAIARAIWQNVEPIAFSVIFTFLPTLANPLLKLEFVTVPLLLQVAQLLLAVAPVLLQEVLHLDKPLARCLIPPPLAQLGNARDRFLAVARSNFESIGTFLLALL